MNLSFSVAEPDRVRRHTKPDVQNRIDSAIQQSIRYHAAQSEEVISARIRELDEEWDVERVLQTNAASLALTTALLGVTVNKKALLLTCGILGFLLQHAVSGWCPPLPLLRRLGVRTRSEIDREKYALKALRGDFRDLPERPSQAEGIAREVLRTVSA